MFRAVAIELGLLGFVFFAVRTAQSYGVYRFQSACWAVWCEIVARSNTEDTVPMIPSPFRGPHGPLTAERTYELAGPSRSPTEEIPVFVDEPKSDRVYERWPYGLDIPAKNVPWTGRA